jgi:hypothetical protein
MTDFVPSACLVLLICFASEVNQHFLPYLCRTPEPIRGYAHQMAFGSEIMNPPSSMLLRLTVATRALCEFENNTNVQIVVTKWHDSNSLKFFSG